MKTNITTVNIARDDAKAPGLTQYDYGQKLLFTGADLPDYYEVHFSANFTDESVTQLGDADGVSIPDAFLTQPGTVHAWIFLHNGMTDGETVRHITIPVAQRSAPGDGQPTPVEQSAFTAGIAALTAKTAEAAEQVELAAAQVALAAEQVDLAAAQVDLAADEVDRAAAEADRAEAAAEDAQAIIREGAVPATRKINGHDLSADVTLTASDVGAVPTTRKVNNKALSADVSLGAADVGAVAKSGDTMTGPLTTPAVTIDASQHPGAEFMQNSLPVGTLVFSTSTRRANLREYPSGSSYYEQYYLPTPNGNLSANATHPILTGKTPVTVAQGGTGANNAASALSNLGAVAKGGDTMEGRLYAPGYTTMATNGYPNVYFQNSGAATGFVAHEASTRRFLFNEFPSDSSAYYESFMMPAPSQGLTANRFYSILTTKQTLIVPTPASGVTINAGGVIQLGRVAIVSMQITTTATIGRDTALMTGMPVSAFVNAAINGLNGSFSVTPFRAEYNALYPSASLAAGTYYISGAYITT